MIDVAPGQNVASALARARSAGGGTVRLLPGLHSGTVDLGFGVALIGEGPATVLRAPAGANRSVVRFLPSPDGLRSNAQFCQVRDLTIDGNRRAQASPAAHGIEGVSNPLHAAATGDADFDMHHLVRDVIVRDVAGDGVHLDGRGEIRLANVQVTYAQGLGFHLAAQDLFIDQCSAGQTARAGFRIIRTGSVQVTGSKAFYAGRLIDGGVYADNRPSPGFHLDGCNGLALGQCIAQDNSGQGFFLENTNRSTVAGLVADSNSKAGAGLYAGVQVWYGEGNDIAGVAFDRAAEGGPVTQLDPLRVDGPGANRISVTPS